MITFSFAKDLKDIDEISESNGKKIILDRIKGTRTVVSPDGKKFVIDLNGKTPYGQSIDPELSRVQQLPVEIIVRYEPLKSDDIFADDVQILFDEFIRAFKGKFGKTFLNAPDRVDIEFSNCRFSEYGYCYKKARNLLVIISIGKGSQKDFQVNNLNLKNKEVRHNLIEDILNYLSSIEVKKDPEKK